MFNMDGAGADGNPTGTKGRGGLLQLKDAESKLAGQSCAASATEQKQSQQSQQPQQQQQQQQSRPQQQPQQQQQSQPQPIRQGLTALSWLQG